MSPENQRIVNDAHLVISYGMRSGRLPKAGFVATAIDAVARIPADQPVPPARIAKLMDLRTGRDPLNPRSRKTLVAMEDVFSALCIARTKLIAVGSFLLNQKTVALAYVVETEAANPREQYIKVWQLYQSSATGGDNGKIISAVLEHQANLLCYADRKLRDAVAIVEPVLDRGSWLFCPFGVSGTSCTTGDIAVDATNTSGNQTQSGGVMSFDAWQAKYKQQPDSSCEQELRPFISQVGTAANNDQLKELRLFPQYGIYFTSVSVPDFSLHELTL